MNRIYFSRVDDPDAWDCAENWCIIMPPCINITQEWLNWACSNKVVWPCWPIAGL